MTPTYDRTKVHTQSSLQQFKRCPYAYKRIYIDGVEQPTTAAMELGTAYHKCMELYANGESWIMAKAETLKEYPTHSVELVDLFHMTEDDLGNPPEIYPPGSTIYAEIESLKKGCAGTIDLAWRDGADATIIDYKTGNFPPPNPHGDFQMMFYAWLAIKDGGGMETVNLVIYNPRFGKRESGPIAAEAFQMFYDEEVSPIIQKIDQTIIDDFAPTTNEYCGNCHVRSECIHYQEAGALAVTLADSGEKPIAAQSPFPTTLTSQGDALRFLLLKPQINAWLKDRDAEARAIVERDGPIEHEGRVYGPKEKKKHTVDPLALAAIYKAHGRSPADILALAKIGKTALYKALTGKENKAIRDDVKGAITTEPDGEKWEWRKA